MDHDDVRLDQVPFALSPNEEWPWRVDGGSVTVTAKPHSDFFVDPGGGDAGVAAESQANAVAVLGDPPAGDFTFSARVSVDFRDTFDAGTLFLWADETHWAKLCFEFSPDRTPMVVSVVTRGVSDDANGFDVDGRAVWLRVARQAGVWAFHASVDGTRWSFVRAFSFGELSSPVRVGLEVQSPMGDGCDVAFSEVTFRSVTLADLRDGS
jgi:regulation of enolase protein 1 (concanavalin A-like superfamily)